MIHHTILRIKSSSMIQMVPNFKTLLKTRGLESQNSADLVSPLPCSKVFPDANPHEVDAQFFEFSKKTEDGPSREGTLSKTFPEIPVGFRVSNGNPESWPSIPLGLGISKGWLGTCDVPELLAVSRS